MKITKELFEKYAIAAISSNALVFDSLTSAFAAVSSKLSNVVLGPKISIDSLSGVQLLFAEKYICLRAFYEQIPQLDLVLTPNGFGVVSNQNLTPASKDRVDSLRKTLLQQSDEALDLLIQSLIGMEDWAKSVNARMLIDSLFYSASALRDYAGKPDAFRSDLFRYRPRIAEAEENIRRAISSVMFNRLLEGTRLKNLTDSEVLLSWSLCKAIGYFINSQGQAFKHELNTAVNLLEDQPDDFPVYKDSEAYKVKHFERYKNEKDDTTYFFG